MKKLSLQLIAFLILFVGSTKAQNLIAVQNGGTPAFYTNLDSAVYYAQSGNTIYLPGGKINCGTLYIGKKLHFIGAGIQPDSSAATKVTQISSGFIFDVNSDGSSLTGISIYGVDLNGIIGGYNISRCLITVHLGIYPSASSSTNNVFRENFIRSIEGGFSQNNTFFNNVIDGYIFQLGSNNLFRNNIFFMNIPAFCSGCYWNAYLLFITDSFFENNIFLCSSCSGMNMFDCGLAGCIFRNNLSVGSIESGVCNTNCNYYNNIENQPQSSIFINQSGNSFNFSHDYHLQSTCPGKNAGTDGTDIGVYGGYYPWKDGSMPVNPHIMFQNIYNSTDLNGNLNVNVKVAAQDH